VCQQRQSAVARGVTDVGALVASEVQNGARVGELVEEFRHDAGFEVLLARLVVSPVGLLLGDRAAAEQRLDALKVEPFASGGLGGEVDEVERNHHRLERSEMVIAAQETVAWFAAGEGGQGAQADLVQRQRQEEALLELTVPAAADGELLSIQLERAEIDEPCAAIRVEHNVVRVSVFETKAGFQQAQVENA